MFIYLTYFSVFFWVVNSILTTKSQICKPTWNPFCSLPCISLYNATVAANVTKTNRMMNQSIDSLITSARMQQKVEMASQSWQGTSWFACARMSRHLAVFLSAWEVLTVWTDWVSRCRFIIIRPLILSFTSNHQMSYVEYKRNYIYVPYFIMHSIIDQLSII